MTHIAGFGRDQLLLLPEAVDDYAEAENPVRFIDAFVDGLDLADAGFARVEAKATGRPGYAPGDLLKLYIYGYLNRVRSSRRLEREAQRNIEVIWLVRGLIPKLSKRDSEGDSRIGVCLIQGGEHGRFAMPIPLRADFDAGMVRAAAKRSKDGPQARRLLALAAIYEGASRTEAAKIGGVTLQIVRDWVMKFNAHGPEGLIDCKPPGQPSGLNGAHRAALAAILESGPIPAVHGVVRWRIVDLCQWIFEEFRVVVAKQTLSRELRAMGYRKLSARPRHHEQAEGAIENFKKSFPARLDEIGREKGVEPAAIEVWFAGTRPASAKRTRSPGVGPSAARVQARRRTNEPPRLISSARSAPSTERVQPSSCPDATRRP